MNPAVFQNSLVISQERKTGAVRYEEGITEVITVVRVVSALIIYKLYERVS